MKAKPWPSLWHSPMVILLLLAITEVLENDFYALKCLRRCAGAPLGLQDSGRQMPAGLPQVRRLSATGSFEHLQRMGSAPLGGGGHSGASYGSRGSLPGSMGGGMRPLGGRMGSGDGARPVGQLASGMPSAAAARLHSLGTAGGSPQYCLFEDAIST